MKNTFIKDFLIMFMSVMTLIFFSTFVSGCDWSGSALWGEERHHYSADSNQSIQRSAATCVIETPVRLEKKIGKNTHSSTRCAPKNIRVSDISVWSSQQSVRIELAARDATMLIPDDTKVSQLVFAKIDDTRSDGEIRSAINPSTLIYFECSESGGISGYHSCLPIKQCVVSSLNGVMAKDCGSLANYGVVSKGDGQGHFILQYLRIESASCESDFLVEYGAELSEQIHLERECEYSESSRKSGDRAVDSGIMPNIDFMEK